MQVLRIVCKKKTWNVHLKMKILYQNKDVLLEKNVDVKPLGFSFATWLAISLVKNDLEIRF